MKVLFLDIETSPYLIRAWGTYETDALEVVEELQVLSVAYRWLGEKKSKVLSQVNGTQVMTERALLVAVWGLMEMADVVVAHNGDKFDLRILRGRMLKHGLAVPKPPRTVDTLKVARKHFKLASNRLNELGKLLGLGTKMEHEGFGLWQKVLAGDKDAWRRMRKYNARDVDLLHDVYLKLRPWMGDGHPHMGTIDRPSCPSCGSDTLGLRGEYRTKTLRKARLCCKNCGAWTSITLPKRKAA